MKEVYKEMTPLELVALIAYSGNYVLYALAVSISASDDYQDLQLAQTAEEYYAFLAVSDNPDNELDDTHFIFAYQTVLSVLGYEQYLGKCGVDGLKGPAFHNTVAAFQKDHDLVETRILDDATKNKIVELIHGDNEIQNRLYNELIQPFEREESQKLLDQKNILLSKFNRYGVMLRLDVAFAAYAADTLLLAETENMHAAFQHCSDNRYFDAMRHSEAVVELSNYWLVPSFTAVSVGNAREYSRANSTPSRLSDMINHEIAISRLDYHEDTGQKYTVEAIIDDVRQGEYILQPVPMVTADFSIDFQMKN